jgi:DNA-binding CsgD family transcriptional regulator
MDLQKKEGNSLIEKLKLSSREYDCFILTFYGFSAKETGRFLNISDRTVNANLRGIFQKLNISRKSQIHAIIKTNELDECMSHFIRLTRKPS